ncbi:hypothetical protein PJI16_12400 [Nitrospira sp. MA-1]|nr:hypothetical protein [Nitrospira sp. MA-1]
MKEFLAVRMESGSVVLWDDFTMDLFWAIFGTAVQLILSFIAPLFLLTGELFLGILSLGYFRPQLKKEALKSELPCREVSFWLGLTIWIGILLYFSYPQE